MSRTLRACAGLLGLLVATAAPLAAQRTYAAFGDSITNGFGDSVEGETAGYPSRLEALLADGSVVRKHGIDGAKISEQGLRALAPEDRRPQKGGDRMDLSALLGLLG